MDAMAEGSRRSRRVVAVEHLAERSAAQEVAVVCGDGLVEQRWPSIGPGFQLAYGPEAPRRSAEAMVVEQGPSGPQVAKIAATVAVADATTYRWLHQDQIDRGELLAGEVVGFRPTRTPSAGAQAGKIPNLVLDRCCGSLAELLT